MEEEDQEEEDCKDKGKDGEVDSTPTKELLTPERRSRRLKSEVNKLAKREMCKIKRVRMFLFLIYSSETQAQ